MVVFVKYKRIMEPIGAIIFTPIFSGAKYTIT